MKEWIDGIMVFLILMNILFLASNRLAACIKIVAVQGIIIAIVPLFSDAHPMGTWNLITVSGTITVKGILLPWLLMRALRAANVRHEVELFVSYPLSIMIGIVIIAASLWISSRLPLPQQAFSPLITPVALSTILVGLFVIISRRKALTQVLGYIILENGIYAFGAALLQEQPVLVELGILLDIFVGVFVMGIAIFHISREFDHIDTQELSALTDLPPAEPEATQ